jgi:hypothetical protein
LQEICDVKQPVLFEFESILSSIFKYVTPELLSSQYGQEILNVKDTKDYYKIEVSKSVDSIPIKCSNAHRLFLNDAGSHYYTENNSEFLEETGLVSKLESVDEYLKPRFTVQTKYDYLTGSNHTTTPLRYHLDYRQYYMVVSGKIRVKMTPWKSCKYLYPIKDYEKYEFRSTYNVWDTSSTEMDKIRFLEFDVEKGNVLYIPSYWWYSIQFVDNTAICAITYNSLMNVVAYLPQWVLYFIQQQNIYTKVVKTIDLQATPVNSANNANLEELSEDQSGEQAPLSI